MTTATKVKKKNKDRSPDRPKYDPDRIMRDQEIDLKKSSVHKAPPAPWADWEDKEIALTAIADDGKNHRDPTAEEKIKLAELAEAIKETNGVMQPIAVQARPGGLYMRVFGSRRCVATKLAGFKTIWAKVSPRPLTEAEVQLYRAIENNDRRELNPAEKALQAHRMVEANADRGPQAAIKYAAAKLHST